MDRTMIGGAVFDKLLGIFGYAPRPAERTGMCRLAYAVCRAVAETMYPDGNPDWPAGTEARVPEEVRDFLQKTVPHKRLLVGCLLWFTELAPILLPPFRRFTKRSPEQRLAILNSWEEGRVYFLNLCASSLRMLFNLAYLSDDRVRERIGEKAGATCADSPAPRKLARNDDGSFEGIIEHPTRRSQNVVEEADFVVIGSGPGGSVVARELAAAGRSVVVLEEGRFHRPEEHTPHAMRILRDVFWDQGLRNTRGNIPVRTFQARALGGTSLVNSAICWRAPGWVFDEWRDKFGVEGLTREALDPHYDKAERGAHVTETESDVLGRKGELFRDGCAGMGVDGAALPRATDGCRGCSECFYGCRTGAKQSMDRTYIPAAIKDGARFHTSSRAEEIIFENGRAAGVRGSIVAPNGKPTGTIEVRAKAVVLSAGVMATPLILMNSRIPRLSPALGQNLCFHNGIAAAGVFEDDVDPWSGATQGYDTQAYIDEGIHMEVLWVPSALLTARTSGFGDPLRRAIGDLKKTAFWCISIHGTSRGRVTKGPGWTPNARFSLNDDDTRRLKRGVELLADHFFAAGAVRVKPGIQGFMPEMSTPDDVATLKRMDLRPEQFVVGGNHVYSTCSMGADPARAVADSDCAVYNAPGLYICDTSVFPMQTAVNPQLTLMAMASKLADTLVDRY